MKVRSKDEQIEKNYGLTLNTEKYFLGETKSTQKNTIIGQFQKIRSKMKVRSKDDLRLLSRRILS